jgi:hypothetical protein
MFSAFFISIILNGFHLMISMKPINLTNQNIECVTWLRKHIFNITQLHMANNEQHPLIYVHFDDFNQLVNINCDENVKVDTGNLLLNAEKKILIENYLNLSQILHLINFNIALNQFPNILLRNIKGFDQTLYNQIIHNRKSSSK